MLKAEAKTVQTLSGGTRMNGEALEENCECVCDVVITSLCQTRRCREDAYREDAVGGSCRGEGMPGSSGRERAHDAFRIHHVSLITPSKEALIDRLVKILRKRNTI